MSGDTTSNAAKPLPAFLPPHMVLRDFLDQADADGLLDYAIGREPAFAPSKVGKRTDHSPTIRVSTTLRQLDAFEPLLRSKVRARIGELVAGLGVDKPDNPGLELELAAHGDGAFYSRHIDTSRDAGRLRLRLISAVYYVHRRPRRFEGGALRLHSFAPGSEACVDVQPEHNTLVAFPSWAPHQVMPVRCPSGQFADSRFAVNIWIHGARRQGAAG